MTGDYECYKWTVTFSDTYQINDTSSFYRPSSMHKTKYYKSILLLVYDFEQLFCSQMVANLLLKEGF